MNTTGTKPSVAELRAQKVAEDQAALANARAQAKAAAERERAASNGRGNGARVDPQDGLFDQVIENGELEQALEAREKVKASRTALNAKFKEADDKAKGIIVALDIEPDTTIRVGRFRITKSKVEGRSVAFETEPTERLTISLLGD